MENQCFHLGAPDTKRRPCQGCRKNTNLTSIPLDLPLSRLWLSRAVGSENPVTCAEDCLTHMRASSPNSKSFQHATPHQHTAAHLTSSPSKQSQPNPTRADLTQKPHFHITPTAPHPTPTHHTNPLHLIPCTSTQYKRPDRTPPQCISANHTPSHV